MTEFLAQLVPCGVGANTPCTICHIWVLADNVVDFLLSTLAAPILIIVLVIGGFMYLTSGGNPKKTETAKSLLSSAIIGIVIALAAWLIINTVLNVLVKKEFVPPWTDIKGDSCPKPLEPEPVDLSNLPKPSVVVAPGTYTTEQEARDALEGFSGVGERVSINKRPCTSAQDSNCTNVAGLPKSTIDYLRRLQEYCSDPKTINCKFTLSGGTEYWLHSENTNHRPGNPVVDVVPNTKTQATYKALVDAARPITTVARCERKDPVLLTGQSQPTVIVSDCSVPPTNHIHFEFRR